MFKKSVLHTYNKKKMNTCNDKIIGSFLFIVKNKSWII